MSVIAQKGDMKNFHIIVRIYKVKKEGLGWSGLGLDYSECGSPHQ